MPLTEQESAKLRCESKRAAVGMGNTIMPILREPPFRCSLKLGEIVGFRYIVSHDPTHPLYYNDWGWEVLGYRHDPKTSRQELIVLHKDGKTINIGYNDVLIPKAA